MPEEVFETPQPVEPVIETKSKSWPKMILAAVLGFGLLAGAAYAGYWYGTESAKVKSQSARSTPTSQPTPMVEDETKDWKTYTNQNHGFSFKHPQDWIYNQNPEERISNPGDILDTIRTQIVPFSYENKTVLVINIFDNPSGLTTVEWLKQREDRQEEKGYLPPYLKGTTFTVNALIDQLPAYKDTRDLEYQEQQAALGRRGGTALPEIHYYVAKEKEVYVIQLDRYESSIDKREACYKLFDQIISTFKFIKVEDQTEGWKVYRSEKYGYTVKYPPDFYEVGPSDSQSASFGPTQYREVIKAYHAVMGIDSTLTTLSPQQFLDKYGNTNTYSNLREVKNITVDGSPAIQFTATNKQTGIAVTHTLVNAKDESGELLIISKYHVGEDKGEVSDEIYNQILSTFKFLD